MKPLEQGTKLVALGRGERRQVAPLLLVQDPDRRGLRRAARAGGVDQERPPVTRMTGRLYGAPATKRSFEASFFDYVRVQDGLIIERVQQADVLGQMRQLYGKALGLVGLDAMYLRL